MGEKVIINVRTFHGRPSAARPCGAEHAVTRKPSPSGRGWPRSGRVRGYPLAERDLAAAVSDFLRDCNPSPRSQGRPKDGRPLDGYGTDPLPMGEGISRLRLCGPPSGRADPRRAARLMKRLKIPRDRAPAANWRCNRRSRVRPLRALRRSSSRREKLEAAEPDFADYIANLRQAIARWPSRWQRHCWSAMLVGEVAFGRFELSRLEGIARSGRTRRGPSPVPAAATLIARNSSASP